MKSHFPRRAAAILAVALLLGAAPTLAGDEAVTYGDGLQLEKPVAISAIHAHPEDHVDETVQVEGRIIDVCRKRGHWMELAGDEEFQSLRIEVEPGVIVFPADCKGDWGVAEGVLRKRTFTLEETRHIAMHKAIEAKEEESFDPEAITEPMTLYILECTGAEIRPGEAGGQAGDQS